VTAKRLHRSKEDQYKYLSVKHGPTEVETLMNIWNILGYW
jgi:hypothetical protein